MRLALSALFFLLPWAASARVEQLPRPETERGYVTLHFPEGFDVGKRYSVLYWFHGTGGQPNAGIGEGHDRFISVGMSYLKRENVGPDGYGAAHWAECLAVRAELEARGLELDRNVVAGMSKGGWMSFYITSEPREGLAAVGIFAAGKDPNVRSLPDLHGRELSVLVGVGETDPNFPQAQLAVTAFKQAGAQVCYEEWPGEGHTYHRDGRVRDWLDVEARRSDPAELQQFCAQSVAAHLQEAERWDSAVERYLALRHLAGDPCLREAGEHWRQRVREDGTRLAAEETVKEWMGGFERLRTLVKREVAFFDRRDFKVPDLEKLVAAYERLLGELKNDVDLAARAAYGRGRAAKMLAIYSEQMKGREDPEYRALMEEYIKLQTSYGEANGNPGEAVMVRLQEVGARLGELRHQAGVGAFHEAEWGRGGGAEPAEVIAALEAAKAAAVRGKVPTAFSGIGF